MFSRIAAALLLWSCTASAAEPVVDCGPISQKIGYMLVYTRQPRLDQPIQAPGYAPIGEAANWQHWYDAGHPDRFTESDLILDNRHGAINAIHNCTDSPDICAAHEGRVSPDGLRIIYTVARGDRLDKVKTWGNGPYTPPIQFYASKYELWLYDLTDGSRQKIDDNGRMPDWASNDEIVFASNRQDTYAPWAHAGNEYPKKALHIYKARISGTKLADVANLSPHAAYAMSPAVFTDGSIWASYWQGFGDRGIGHTPANMWWVESVNADGTNHQVQMGAHGSGYFKTRDLLTGICDPKRCGEGSTAYRVLRQAVELPGDRFGVTNYYRGNHLGSLGAIFVCDRIEAEGYLYSADVPALTYPNRTPGSGRFVPNCYVATPYGNDADNLVRWHRNGKPMGKAGYVAPAPITEGKFLFTHARGESYEAALPERAYREAMGGEPTSKREIRAAGVDVITDPFDPDQSRVIACPEDKWNCWDARFVASYSDLYGQTAPDTLPPVKGDKARLQVVNARQGEIYPLVGPNVKERDKISYQGNGNAALVEAIRIDLVAHWPKPADRKGFYKSELLGEFPLKGDGSVAFDIPCDTPYQLRGIDADGKVVAEDNTVHSERCGEVVTCHGCHDAHSVQRAAELGDAVQAFRGTEAGILGTTAL